MAAMAALYRYAHKAERELSILQLQSVYQLGEKLCLYLAELANSLY